VVGGGAIARHLYRDEPADLKAAPSSASPAGVELARRTSAPLIEDLRVTDKVSQNLHAEMALRAVGRARRNVGSLEAGLEELRVFLGEAGIDPASWNINDGSGLARLNLVTLRRWSSYYVSCWPRRRMTPGFRCCRWRDGTGR